MASNRRLHIVFVSLLLLGSTGCLNPFAPKEGGLSGDLWDSQTTVGGLLRNFRTSYALRDSLRYADLIADDFLFQYFNTEESRYDQWYRATELRTTGGLMRNYDRLDLRWGPIPADLDTFSLADTTVEFSVTFNLSVGDMDAIYGFARFKARAGDDHRFRLTQWRDDY